jgi:hypothetical protein
MIRVWDVLARLLATGAMAFFALTMLIVSGAPVYAYTPNNVGCGGCGIFCRVSTGYLWSSCLPATGSTGLGKSCQPGKGHVIGGKKSQTCKVSGGESQSVNCMCNFWGGSNGVSICSCSKTIKKTRPAQW